MVRKERTAYIDATGEEAPDEKHAVQHAVCNVAQLHVLHAAGAEVTYRAEHADGTKGYEAYYSDLRPWRIVCLVSCVERICE